KADMTAQLVDRAAGVNGRIVHVNLAFLYGLKAVHGSDQGGFSGAGRPAHNDDFPLPDLRVDVVKGQVVAIPFAYVLELNHLDHLNNHCAFDLDAAFNQLHQTAKDQIECEVRERQQTEYFERFRQQHVIDLCSGEGKFMDADHKPQRSFLYRRNELTEHAWQRVVQGLRQDNAPHGLGVA